MRGKSWSAPVADGFHSCMWTPFGTNKNAIRTGGFADAAPVKARTGFMLSSIGSDAAAPSPLRNVRL
jgi:hypothetical protein